jgi:hypothetical protein
MSVGDAFLGMAVSGMLVGDAVNPIRQALFGRFLGKGIILRDPLLIAL